MSAYVLLNLLNEFGKNDTCEAFCNEFNKANNTGARILDFTYGHYKYSI